MEIVIELIFKILVAHAFCDFSLKITKMEQSWFNWATGNYQLGIVEVFLHMIIDNYSDKNCLSMNKDQLLHIICRVIYIGVIIL